MGHIPATSMKQKQLHIIWFYWALFRKQLENVLKAYFLPEWRRAVTIMTTVIQKRVLPYVRSALFSVESSGVPSTATVRRHQEPSPSKPIRKGPLFLFQWWHTHAHSHSHRCNWDQLYHQCEIGRRGFWWNIAAASLDSVINAVRIGV